MKWEPLFDLRLLWDQAINLMISQNSQSACPKYSFLVFCHSSRWVSFKPVQNSIELAKWWQQTKMLLKLSYFRNNKKMNVERGITWNWASSGSPARISSVTKWTPRCWGRRCNWKMVKTMKWKSWNGQFITFRFSQALGPMVRPEPLGSDESSDACKEGGAQHSSARGKKWSSLRERPISEEYADCVKLFTGLPACLRAADTDLDLWAEGDRDCVGAEHEVFARSACRFDVEEWWPSLLKRII